MANPAESVVPLLSDLPASAGLYHGTAADWTHALVPYTEVPAFVALLGWVVVILLWRAVPGPRRLPAWSWLPGLAATGLAIPLVLDLVTGALQLPAVTRSFGDIAIAAAFLGGAAVVTHASLALRRKASFAAMLILALLVVGLVLWHAGHAPSSGWIITGITLLAALHAGLQPRATRASRLALAVWAVGPLFSSIGPIADQAWLLQRHHSHSRMVVLTAALQAVVAWSMVAGFVRDVLADVGPARRRELLLIARRPLRLALVALAVGVGLAFIAGENIQRRRDVLKFDRHREVVLSLNVAAIEQALGNYHLGQVRMEPRGTRPPTPVADAQLAPPAVAAALQRRLDEAFASSAVTDVRFVTLHEGWVVAVASSATRWRQSGGPAPRGAVLLEPIGPRDREEWSRRAPVARWRSFDRATYQTSRLPIFGHDERMLGWLETTDIVATHHVGPNQTRSTWLFVTIIAVALVTFLAIDRGQAEARERALRAAAAAEEASRAKSDFLLRVNRELHAPLQALAARGERLRTQVRTETARRHLEAIQAQGELMQRLAADLVDLEAIKSGSFRWDPRPVDPAAVLRATVESLRPRAAIKNLDLACHVAPEVPTHVELDAARFQQIAANLIGNAVKFTERGGVRVTLSLAAPREETPWLELSVADSGPGIAAEDRPRLFEAFSRLASTAHKTGTGLGLAVSATLCQRAGGTLSVESDGRSGSRFIATFPLEPAATSPA